ncbi:putative RNA-binding protein ARP1, partial [Mucuna pruriens]
MTTNNNNNVAADFGDTTLTKVFVGGLAWETPNDAFRDHFRKYGQILEAVIISDKLSGKSKGYGFVTFKDPEAAKKACEDSTPLIINGRRANCNLAFLGARRTRSSSTSSPPQGTQIHLFRCMHCHIIIILITALLLNDSLIKLNEWPFVMLFAGGSNGGGLLKNNVVSNTPDNHVQRYYHPAGTTALPFHQHTLPFYGYPPTYIMTDMNYIYNYNQKLCYGSGGAYMNGHHLSHVYPRQAMVGANTLMPMYPVYQYHHPTETIGLPANNFYQTPAWQTGPVPIGIMSKPSSTIPNAGASRHNTYNPVNVYL